VNSTGGSPQSEEYARIINTNSSIRWSIIFRAARSSRWAIEPDEATSLQPFSKTSPRGSSHAVRDLRPILPVLPVKDMDERCSSCKAREALAFYCSRNKAQWKSARSIHVGRSLRQRDAQPSVVPGLRRRGGNSGRAKYHGEWGFEIPQRPCCAESCTSFGPSLATRLDGDKLERMKKLMTMHIPSALEGITGWMLVTGGPNSSS